MTTVSIRNHLVVFAALLVLGTLPIQAQTAQVQFVHNTPYAEADTVDIYVNGVLLLDDFTFREATPFTEWAAETNLAVDITAPDAADHTSPIVTDTLRLDADKNYVVVAAGDPLGRDDQPGFDLFNYDQARLTSSSSGTVQILGFNGVPDILRYKFILRPNTEVGNTEFGNFSDGYGDGGAGGRWDVDMESSEGDLLLPTVWDMRDISDRAVVNMGSGFVDPPTTDAPSLESLSVWDDGSTTLSPHNVAMVQLIHNVPFPEVDTVDVYSNDVLLMDDVPFRTASAFTEWNAGTDVLPTYRIDITASDAADNSDPLYTKTFSVHYDQSHMLVLSAHPFANPGSPDLQLYSYSRLVRLGIPGDGELLVIHGSPQADTVDVKLERGLLFTSMAENLSYANSEAFTEVDGDAATVYIRRAGEKENLAIFSPDPDALKSASALMLSGYMEPGADFQLAMVPAAGGAFVESVVVSGVATEEADEMPSQFALHGNYPNPFNPTTTLRFDLPAQAEVSVAVYDLLGRQVLTMPTRPVAAGSARTLMLDASTLASGMYVYRLTAHMATQTTTATATFLLMK